MDDRHARKGGEDVNTFGNWAINWNKFAQQYGVRTLEELVLSTMPEVPGIPFQRPADDFSAMYNDGRARRDCYLRIIPTVVVRILLFQWCRTEICSSLCILS